MPSPSCTVNGTAAPPAVAVTASSTPTIALAVPAGANFWQLQAVSADELTSIATINASLSVNMGTKTATFTAPSALGSAVIFQSIVGVKTLGTDAGGTLQPSYFTTFKVNVLTASGLAVVALNEILEQSLTNGWIGEINAAVRASGSGSLSPTTPQILTAPGTIPTTGLQQFCGMSTTGGSFTQPMPAAGVAGLTVTVLDPSKSWAAHAASVSVGAGVSIENPAALGGTYVTNGTLALPTVNGASYSWLYLSGSSLWKLI